jgi:hypothetical protein
MIVGVLATGLLLSLTAVPSRPEQCRVGIQVLGSTHKYAHGISAALGTKGPFTVYIPKYEKVGFRVVRARTSEPESIPPELIEIPSRKIRGPSLTYDFKQPLKLRVWWTDVAAPEPGSSEGFTVQPERYRFSVVYSESDPSEVHGKQVVLCRAYSDSFEVSESSHFLQLP